MANYNISDAHLKSITVFELRGIIEKQEERIEKLKHAARLIHSRKNMTSGSPEMAECDILCKEVGLEVWTW